MTAATNQLCPADIQGWPAHDRPQETAVGRHGLCVVACAGAGVGAGAWQAVLTSSCVCVPILQIPIKSCRDVCFSNGGQYFAAINGITLSIYNTYTCECVGNLRGHNGKVGSPHPSKPPAAGGPAVGICCSLAACSLDVTWLCYAPVSCVGWACLPPTM